MELQRPYARHDRARNRALAALARRLGIRCVATGDVHAHDRSRAELQDAFVALRNHATLDASEPLRRGNHSHVMSTPQAMASRFADHPEAVRETLLPGRAADVRSDGATSATATRAPRTSAPRRGWRSCARRSPDRALRPGGRRTTTRPGRAWRRS